MYSIAQCVRIRLEPHALLHANLNIFLYPTSNKRSPTHTECKTKYKIKILSATHERVTEECCSFFEWMLKKRTQKTEMPGACSHWRYNTVCALYLSPRQHPQLQPTLHLHHGLGTSGVPPHPGEGNGLVLFVLNFERPLFVECVSTVYLSEWLAPGEEGVGWQNDAELQTSTGPGPVWRRPAPRDVWRPRRRTWTWEDGGQICSPPQRRWPRPDGSPRRGLRWWEEALRCETWGWAQIQKDDCGWGEAEGKEQYYANVILT